MSKGPMLRVLVNQRLSAAAEEIFALFERTVLEYEEELCRSVEENQKKQRLLDTLLSPAALPHATATRVRIPPPSPPGPSQEEEESLEFVQVNETLEPARVKDETEETEEQRVKQEEEQLLPELEPAFNPLCVKTEESSLLQQRPAEHKEETWEEDIHLGTHFHPETAVHTERSPDNRDNWAAPFSCSRADRDHYNQIQTRDRSPAGSSPDHRSVPETSVAVHNGDASDTSQGAERKKYQCFVCQKIFGSKIVLQIHIRVHTGEKPYSCPICKKAFAQKNNLNAHKITHTGEKPYSCSLCRKTFGRRCTLKRHMKVHTAGNSFNANKSFNDDFQTDESPHGYL